MAEVVLRADGVRKHYGELEVLKGVSFEVERGQQGKTSAVNLRQA